MPLLDCRFLKSYREQRLAHLALAAITMGFVWQEGEAQPPKVRGKEKALRCCWAPCTWNYNTSSRFHCLISKNQWKVRKEG